MARSFEMTWIANRRGWMKEYKGKKYAVSCRQLGAEETKEGSYQAANAWWERKRAEIDGRPEDSASDTAPDPVAVLGRLLAGHTVREFEGIASQGSAAVKVLTLLERLAQDAAGPVERLPNGSFVGPMPDLDAALAQLRGGAGMPKGMLGEVLSLPDNVLGMVNTVLAPYIQEKQLTPTDQIYHLERLANDLKGPKATETARTIAAHAEAWHKTQEATVSAGLLTPDRCSNNRTCLAHFRTFLTDTADVGTIDAASLHNFYLHCLTMVSSRRQGRGTGWSVAYARDVFSVTKGFVRWLWEQGAIDLPKNIGSKSFKFGNCVKAIETWTTAEFKMAVEQAPGKLKLALLLMTNCGMTQEDVSDLLDSEVDWTEGRITRKRSKTGSHENVPTVCYKLWPSTFELLKKFRSGTERVLLTESGLPYVRKMLKANGKLSKANGFASSWVHVKKRIKLNRPLKHLRKLGATLLEKHETYGRLKVLFLGHSPKSVTDRHYAAPPQALFDAAILWMGQQLDQC